MVFIARLQPASRARCTIMTDCTYNTDSSHQRRACAEKNIRLLFTCRVYFDDATPAIVMFLQGYFTLLPGAEDDLATAILGELGTEHRPQVDPPTVRHNDDKLCNYAPAVFCNSGGAAALDLILKFSQLRPSGVYETPFHLALLLTQVIRAGREATDRL